MVALFVAAVLFVLFGLGPIIKIWLKRNSRMELDTKIRILNIYTVALYVTWAIGVLILLNDTRTIFN